VAGVQAKEKDGGTSFTCAESKPWRKDFKCFESPSDFMTTGEHHGRISAIPKGFVRVVHLRKIDELDARKLLTTTDRDVYYFYCGDADGAPDTAGWQPFGEQMAAALEKDGRRLRILGSPLTNQKNSVFECLKQYPVLGDIGVTLEDFCFSKTRSETHPNETLDVSETHGVAPVGVVGAAVDGHVAAAEPAPTASAKPSEPAATPVLAVLSSTSSMEESTASVQPPAPELGAPATPQELDIERAAAGARAEVEVPMEEAAAPAKQEAVQVGEAVQVKEASPVEEADAAPAKEAATVEEEQQSVSVLPVPPSAPSLAATPVVQPARSSVKQLRYWQPCASCASLRNVPKSVHDEVSASPFHAQTPSDTSCFLCDCMADHQHGKQMGCTRCA
jgi:hypothetical protein